MRRRDHAPLLAAGSANATFDSPVKQDLGSVYTKLNYYEGLNDFPNSFIDIIHCSRWFYTVRSGSFCYIFLYRSKE
jgi:hypothetical protein